MRVGGVADGAFQPEAATGRGAMRGSRLLSVPGAALGRLTFHALVSAVRAPSLKR